MDEYQKLFLGLVLLSFSNVSLASGGFAPAKACAYMAMEGFRGSTEYHEFKGGQFRCSTLRKPIPRGEPPASDVRYVATGNASAVTRLALELRMRSGRSPQQVLIQFDQYVTALLEKALNEKVLEELSTSIRSAVPGEWQQVGRTLKLVRSQDRGITYDLIFSIE